MIIVSLLFGSNLGDRTYQISRSIQLLVENNLELLQVSKVYESEAWGVENQPSFYNVAAEFKTNLLPKDLLTLVKQIETEVGRTARAKWHEREIDIDIIFYGNEKIKFKDLEIPHPYLIRRNFVLLPLSEINEGKVHPILELTIAELLRLSIDNKEVKPVQEQLKLQ